MAHTVWLKGIDADVLYTQPTKRPTIACSGDVSSPRQHYQDINYSLRILEIPEFPYNLMRNRLKKEARVLKYQFDPFIRLAYFDPVSASNRQTESHC